MQIMRELRVTVSTAEQAIEIARQGALPVFSVQDMALSAAASVAPEELPESIPFGVMLNQPIPESRLEQFRETVDQVLGAGAVWIYFSDPAMLACCGEQERKRCIYRPETLLTSPQDASFWMDQGIGGVSVSPLLTRQETMHILSAVPHAEVTLHGHLLLSVSRRKLLSAWKTYYRIDLEPVRHRHLAIRETTRQEDMPVYETENGTMIFSDYVLESFEECRDFAQADAGLIESSFLEPETLYETVGLYQRILNGESCQEEIEDYRKRHPECSKGYYDQKTIL